MLRTCALLAALALLPAAPGALAQDAPTQADAVDVGSTALWIDFAGGMAYVTNPEDGTIAVIDIAGARVVDTIAAQEGVGVIKVAEDKGVIYATMQGMPHVAMFDVGTGAHLGDIDIGDAEVTLFSTSDQPYGQREYVTFSTSAIGLDYNPHTGMLYAVQSTVNKVNVIDTETNENVADIVVGKAPLQISIDESRNVGYVTNHESGNISVIDLNTNEVTRSLQTGFAANQLQVDTVADTLYVTHLASPHVTAVDLATHEIKAKIQLDGPTHAVSLDDENGILHVTYVPESGVTGAGAEGRVEFIDTSTNENVGSLDIPENPFAIDVHRETGILFASILGSGDVVVVDLGTDPEYQAVVAAAQAAPAPGGGCLVATAAYGTEMAPQVQALREVRDGAVMGTEAGRAFMGWFNGAYYSFSPAVADAMREHPALRGAVAALITPMVHSLAIMSLAGSDGEVVALGASVIALNLGMYAGAPALAVLGARRLL